MKKVLFKTVKQMTAEPACNVHVFDNKGKWLGDFVADYRLTEGDNVDFILDLYNLDATVKFITVNSVDNMIEFSVEIKRNHPLFKYSVWSEEVL